jgi:probable HAF family extracellular repeat protein
MRKKIISIALIAWSGCAAAHHYTVTELGPLGCGRQHCYFGINSSGQVVANAVAPTGLLQAALYSKGSITYLGSLSGPSGFSVAGGLNDSAQVAGSSFNAAGELDAFLYSNGAMQDLGTLPGGSFSQAFGVNERGQVVGFGTTTISPDTLYEVAFRYSNGAMQILGTLGSYDSFGMGINDSGQVTGYSYLPDNVTAHAFLYTNGAMADIGSLGGAPSVGYAINNRGQVTGYSYLPDNITEHAFLYSNGAMTDLGTLGGTASYGWGMNDVGHVVGGADTPGDTSLHAFIYRNGKLADLNTLVADSTAALYTLTEARGINRRGQIVATGTLNATGSGYIFLLTPIPIALSDLLVEVAGVGPGKSLANDIVQARAYYAVNEVPATCRVLTAFVNEVLAQNGKKISTTFDTTIIADADSIRVAIGCQ